MEAVNKIRKEPEISKISKKHKNHRETTAFPRVNLNAYEGYQGLTRREYVAAAVLQSLLSGAGTVGSAPAMGPAEAAKFSLGYADALLALTSDEWSY